MSASSIEALASAWARVAEEATLPHPTTKAQPCQKHIWRPKRSRRGFVTISSPPMTCACLASGICLAKHALRMEQTLWPEDFERMTREVEQVLREADDPDAKCYTTEEVIQAMRERIDRVRDKPC